MIRVPGENGPWLCHQYRWETREGPKLNPEGLLKLHVNFQMLYQSLRCFVSCWVDSYVARSWYRGPAPGPWVLTLEVGEVLDQKLFQSQKILHPTSIPASSCCNQSWVMLISVDKADFFCWKPHWQFDSGWCSARWSDMRMWKCFSSFFPNEGNKLPPAFT